MREVPAAYAHPGHGPLYAVRRSVASPSLVVAVTWSGHRVIVPGYELRPFPATASGAPMYEVPGVREIVELQVDLGETNKRTRSPLVARVVEIEMEQYA
jgi:hypothetical protein